MTHILLTVFISQKYGIRAWRVWIPCHSLSHLCLSSIPALSSTTHNATFVKLKWLDVTSPQLTVLNTASVKGERRGCVIKHLLRLHKGMGLASVSKWF